MTARVTPGRSCISANSAASEWLADRARSCVYSGGSPRSITCWRRVSSCPAPSASFSAQAFTEPTASIASAAATAATCTFMEDLNLDYAEFAANQRKHIEGELELILSVRCRHDRADAGLVAGDGRK